MYTALRATSLTLRELLRRELRSDAILSVLFDPASPVGPGNMDVSLDSPQELTGKGEGLSLWLYQVTRDPERLNAPPERPAPDQLRRVPLPVRLHYLATPILDDATASSSETEQLIMGKVLQVLHDQPILHGSALRGELMGTAVELHVRLEPLDLESVSRVYEALDRSWQLSVSYEVSVVHIASAGQPERISPVRVVIPDYAVIVDPAEAPS